jgi:hypothetical protein
MEKLNMNESEDDKYASIGYDRYKLKGKEDDENADVFVKTDSGDYVKSDDQKSNDSGEKVMGEEKLILTKKYDILKKYQFLLYLLMFVGTGYTLYLLNNFLEASKRYGGGYVMNDAILSMIIAYVISMFSLFCLTKIIDFLFDLDKKSNK